MSEMYLFFWKWVDLKRLFKLNNTAKHKNMLELKVLVSSIIFLCLSEDKKRFENK